MFLLVEMISIIIIEYGNKSVVVEIMRELGRKDLKDLVRDNIGIKSFVIFFVELFEKVFGVMMFNISVVFCYLEGEVKKSVGYLYLLIRFLIVI